MHRKEVIKNTSEISGVDIDACEKVIGALEKVLEEEFSSTEGLSDAFYKFCKLIHVFKIKLI